MRVAFNNIPNELINQLGGLMSQQSALETQLSSGQRIKMPEDDPNGMSLVLTAQSQAQATDQYTTNVTRQQESVTASYSAINSLKTLSDRASEIATLASGVTSPSDLAAYAKEIDEMIPQAVHLANGKDQNNYLFGGTSGAPPFVTQTDGQGNVTGVTYQGNTNVNQYEIADGSTFSSPVVGANTTGTGPRGLITDATSGADFFTHLIALRNDLNSDNTASIASNDAPALQDDSDNFIYHVGLNGALQARLESAASSLKDQTLALNTQVSDVASTDIATTTVKLSQAQNAYQAALQSSGKLLNMSLMDYLQ
jgi:flagellar hook-associated protein 3 FlgL